MVASHVARNDIREITRRLPSLSLQSRHPCTALDVTSAHASSDRVGATRIVIARYDRGTAVYGGRKYFLPAQRSSRTRLSLAIRANDESTPLDRGIGSWVSARYRAIQRVRVPNVPRNGPRKRIAIATRWKDAKLSPSRESTIEGITYRHTCITHTRLRKYENAREMVSEIRNSVGAAAHPRRKHAFAPVTLRHYAATCFPCGCTACPSHPRNRGRRRSASLYFLRPPAWIPRGSLFARLVRGVRTSVVESTLADILRGNRKNWSDSESER